MSKVVLFLNARDYNYSKPVECRKLFLASPDVHIILKPYQRIDIDAEQYTKVDLTRGIES
jgi:hypothetical protein